MNKIYVFAVVACCMAATVAFQSSDDAQERQSRQGEMRDGKRCPRQFRNQTVTAGNQTCFCKEHTRRALIFRKYYRWQNCTNNATDTTTTVAPPTNLTRISEVLEPVEIELVNADERSVDVEKRRRRRRTTTEATPEDPEERRRRRRRTTTEATPEDPEERRRRRRRTTTEATPEDPEERRRRRRRTTTEATPEDPEERRRRRRRTTTEATPEDPEE